MESMRWEPRRWCCREKAADEVQEHYFEAFWGKPLANVIADLQVLGTPAYFAVHTVGLKRGSRDAEAESRFLATPNAISSGLVACDRSVSSTLR